MCFVFGKVREGGREGGRERERERERESKRTHTNKETANCTNVSISVHIHHVCLSLAGRLYVHQTHNQTVHVATS